MKHIAAYLLLPLTNPHPTKEDVTSLLATVGIEPNKERLDPFFSMLEGKDVNQVPSIS
jgi:ribosomal protein L12E/L44/L45/RPP1/RPP2